MAITQALCSSFKQELLEGIHNFSAVGGDTFKIALYSSTANLSGATTVYTAVGETTGTGYTAGGNTLTNLGAFLSGTTSYTSFANAVWSSASISTAGALIYNASKGNKAVTVLNFGGTYANAGTDFTVVFPTNSPATAPIIFN